MGFSDIFKTKFVSDAEPGVRAFPRAVIDRKGALTEADESLTRLALAGWSLKSQIDGCTDQLERINAQLIATIGPGAAIWVDGVVRAPVSARLSVKVTDPEGLAAALGARFGDLVQTTTTYKPTPKLLDLAANADDPLGKAVAACLTPSESISISYLGGKPLPAGV